MSTVAAAGSQNLWFLSRGSGLVLLVLFSIVVGLGVATRTGSAPRHWPRFAVAELHRTLSLFAVALLVLHVVTAILDPFVTIGSAAAALGPAHLAGRPLARLPGLAGRVHPLADGRQRPRHLVGGAGRGRLGRGGGGGRARPGVQPVPGRTAIRPAT